MKRARWQTGSNGDASVDASASLSNDGGGGWSFDPKAIASKMPTITKEIDALKGAAQAVSSHDLTPGDLLAAEMSIGAGVTAAFPAAAPFAAAVVALTSIGIAIASAIPTEHAVTRYPTWQGDPRKTWMNYYGMGSGWPGQAWYSPALDTPNPGTFEAYYYGTIWAALDHKHTSTGAIMLTPSERLTLFVAALSAWNAAHSSSAQRTIARRFTANPGGFGAPTAVYSFDPITMSLPFPQTPGVVSFVVNEGPPVLSVSASDLYGRPQTTSPMISRIATTPFFGGIFAPATPSAAPSSSSSNSAASQYMASVFAWVGGSWRFIYGGQDPKAYADAVQTTTSQSRGKGVRALINVKIPGGKWITAVQPPGP